VTNFDPSQTYFDKALAYAIEAEAHRELHKAACNPFVKNETMRAKNVLRSTAHQIAARWYDDAADNAWRCFVAAAAQEAKAQLEAWQSLAGVIRQEAAACEPTPTQ
jgi:hypothetical protein